ncbi:MAG: helix-turn-helix domain-containing protein [bacterium]
MSEAGFYMSKKEVDRLLVLKDLRSKKINQIEASRLLGITDRHVRRLVKSYVMEGKSGLVSKKRGVVSNNKISDRDRAMMMLIVSGHYYDFGPTLACEKLREVHDLHVSRETLRKWMIEDGIWKPKKKKKGKAQHQMRERRSTFGELIQIDGSPHDWFEGRRAPCTLIVFIDDATGEYMELRFYESETTVKLHLI